MPRSPSRTKARPSEHTGQPAPRCRLREHASTGQPIAQDEPFPASGNLHPGMLVTDRELAAIERLLGEDLLAFLGRD